MSLNYSNILGKSKHLNNKTTIMLHMSQIYYNIIAQLIKQNVHIRGLAKLINTNQTTIARKVIELEKNNVVDFRIEGKNKVFFIKNSIEAKESIKILEHKKLLEILSKVSELRIIVEKIKEDSNIHLAILFGSYAKGTRTEKSDIDLYVETENQNMKKKLELINSKLSIKIGLFDKKNLLIKEIIKNHIIIKGVDLYCELVH